jgi:hypothetical protein
MLLFAQEGLLQPTIYVTKRKTVSEDKTPVSKFETGRIRKEMGVDEDKKKVWHKRE